MNFFSALGLAASGILMAIGTGWAFHRGGNDFAVFHEAMRLVVQGRGMDIYHATPDRFLYAPGFAWIFAPLGLLPRDIALALWCFFKAACVGLIIRIFARRLGGDAWAWGICGWATVMIARPLLIDFQYGQVNLLILAACVWALVSRFTTERASFWDFARWWVLALAAISKLYPMPLLVIPWAVTRGIPKARLKRERWGIVSCLLIIALLPLATLGWDGFGEIHSKWKGALISRGLPTETHNQSIAALLNRYLSGMPVHIISQGSEHKILGKPLLSAHVIGLLSVIWLLVTSALSFAWIVFGKHRDFLKWSAIAIGMLIVPLHLVWKPYFVLALPAFMVAMADAARAYESRESIRRWIFLVLIFLAMNLTSFDFIGIHWAGQAEAISLFMWAHLALLVLTLRAKENTFLRSPQRQFS